MFNLGEAKLNEHQQSLFKFSKIKKKKKMQFQQNVQNFYRAKTQKYKSIT